MARKSPEPDTQAAPTAARPIDADGRMLDAWGLPLGGPARARALDGRTDPHVDAIGWDAPSAPAAAPAPTPDAGDAGQQD